MAATKKAALKAAEDFQPPNIWQRINAIQGAATVVAKLADVGGKYKAVTHDDVARMLKPLLSKNGVVIHCTHLKTDVVDTGVNYGKRPLKQLQSLFNIRFVNVDDPDDCVEVLQSAWADDDGDKGPGKVQSYAVKYACLKLFQIPTGEDDEARIPEEKIMLPPLTEDQQVALGDKAEELFGDDGPRAIAKIVKDAKVKSISELPEEHYKYYLETLDFWAANRAKKHGETDKD